MIIRHDEPILTPLSYRSLAGGFFCRAPSRFLQLRLMKRATPPCMPSPEGVKILVSFLSLEKGGSPIRQRHGGLVRTSIGDFIGVGDKSYALIVEIAVVVVEKIEEV